MDVDFEAKRLKPGDDGFVWDKEVEFAPAEEDNEWDAEEDDWKIQLDERMNTMQGVLAFLRYVVAAAK